VSERMFGIETEYALSALGRKGARVDQDPAFGRFMEMARRTLVHLPDHSSYGMFLQNGSRFYVDYGRHPEMATCEVVNPWDACRYVLAGEQILAALAEQVVAEDGLPGEIFLTRCNVCYSPGRPATWGCHESYGHRVPPAELPGQLIPHLVSRIIYTGAGGFDNRFPGIRFTISPRVAHLEHVASESSTSSRGIYHSKDESLSGNGYHRLHVLCGESVCSQTSLWLKTGVTALVVALIEAGLEPCAAIRLRDPLGAMKRFADDVTLGATAESLDGKSRTALEMQRHVLGQIEAHAGHPIMPPWTLQVCQRLRQVLDRLEQGPRAVATTLDWAIKLALYQELARRRGFSWESLAPWNEALARRHRQPARDEPLDRARLTLRMLLEHARTALEEIRSPDPPSEVAGVDQDQSRAALALRHELFELDTRFGQLGPRSLFAVLDRTGALDHRVPGVDNIEHAIENPPAVGRARLRGHCVRRFHGQQGRFACDWSAVLDRQQHTYLDLSEPFATEEHWHETHQRPQPISGSPPSMLPRLLDDARRSYNQGRYELAYQILENLRPFHECIPRQRRLEWQRLRSWVQCRRGFFDGLPILNGLAREHPDALWLTLDYVSTHRFGGLAPRPETAQWIQTGRDQLQRDPDQTPDRITCFHEHRGYFLMTEGRLDEARQTLQLACDSPRALSDTRILCRAMAVLGETHRRLGNRREATRLVETAVSEQTAREFLGERAGFSWTCLAKLQADPATARQILGQVKATQLEFHDRMGEARTLLLEARLAADTRAAEPLRQRVLQLRDLVPALAQCRLLAKVLDRWEAWAGGVLTADESGDVFWGV